MVIQKAAKKQGHNGCTQKYAVKIALFENDLNGLYPVQAVAEYTENAASWGYLYNGVMVKPGEKSRVGI